jgi:CheY-like chemotaxis protein
MCYPPPPKPIIHVTVLLRFLSRSIEQPNFPHYVMARASILEVGHATELLQTRSLVLRNAGYQVIEETDIKRALSLAQSDQIDIVMLCHSLYRKEAAWLARMLREERSLLPIVCVVSNLTDEIPPGCWSAPASPDELLDTLEQIMQQPPTARSVPTHRVPGPRPNAAKKNPNAT